MIVCAGTLIYLGGTRMLLLDIIPYMIVFLYGIVIGSFLNVCIYRLPKGENIVTVGSHCMNCSHKLKPYELIPVFSFLFQRGRCRYCHTKLSCQYPIVEAGNGMLYIIIFIVNGFTLSSVLYCCMTSAMLVLSVIDYRTMEIPFGINLVIFAMGVVLTIIDNEFYISHLIGFFSVSLFLLCCFLVTRGKGIGLGDVILMAAAGLGIGVLNIWLALIFGCLIGSVLQIIKMISTGEGRKFAFGPYLSVGIFIAMLWGNRFFEWYVGLIYH